MAGLPFTADRKYLNAFTEGVRTLFAVMNVNVEASY
jgi:hypothetical protein